MKKFFVIFFVAFNCFAQFANARPKPMGDWESSGAPPPFEYEGPADIWKCQAEVVLGPKQSQVIWLAEFELSPLQAEVRGKDLNWFAYDRNDRSTKTLQELDAQNPVTPEALLFGLQTTVTLDKEPLSLDAYFGLRLNLGKGFVPKVERKEFTPDAKRIHMKNNLSLQRSADGTTVFFIEGEVFCNKKKKAD